MERLVIQYDHKKQKQITDKLTKQLYHYNVQMFIRMKGGEETRCCYITKDDSCEFAKYMPSFWFEDGKFQIQTLSFGALFPEEYQKFCMAVQNAYYLVSTLNEYDWKQVPILVIPE